MRKIFIASLLLLTVVLCSNCSKEVSVGNSETISVSVCGTVDEMFGDTKGYMSTTIVAIWSVGDVVYVFGGKEYLGTLAVSSVQNASREAYLTGTIKVPGTEVTQLTLIYSSLPYSTTYEVGDSYDNVRISLATQTKDKLDVILYGSLNYSMGETSISNVRFPMNYASTAINVSCYNLWPSTAINAATISNIQTDCVITLKSDGSVLLLEDTVTADGTMMKTTINAANTQGERLITYALPAVSSTSKTRVLTVYQDGYIGVDNTFSKSAMTIGNSYATMCGLTTQPAYGGGIDPYEHVDWKW